MRNRDRDTQKQRGSERETVAPVKVCVYKRKTELGRDTEKESYRETQTN